MRFFVFTVLLVWCVTSVASAAPDGKGLRWKKNYGTAKRVAQAAKRPMLLVLEDPTKKSRSIDETKLKQKERTILNKDQFELCRVDVNTEYGKRVAAAFGARVFPYTVVTDDASKRIVFRKPGPMSEKDWTLALAKNSRLKFAAGSSPGATTRQDNNFGFPVDGRVLIQPFVPARANCFT